MKWFSRRPKFCGKCGQPLTEWEKPAPLQEDGRMWRLLSCPEKTPWNGHYWTVIKEWSQGPSFDPYTGQAQR